MNIALAAAGLTTIAMTAASLNWPTTRIDIHTEIEIAAPPQAVWSVLADTGRYGDWNPYHVSVDGELAKGAKLRVTVHKPNGNTVTVPPHVIAVEPSKRLVWGGGIPGIFKGEHTFELEPVGENCTRLVHKETFAGLFVGFAELGTIEEGYELMNAALKEKVETGRDPRACR